MQLFKKLSMFTLFVVGFSETGAADPASHIVAFESHDIKGDCANGMCIPVCVITGRAVNVSTEATPAFFVYLRYFGQPGLDADQVARIGFNFDRMEHGAIAEAKDYVNGLECSEIHVDGIEASTDINAPQILKGKILMSVGLDIGKITFFFIN